MGLDAKLKTNIYNFCLVTKKSGTLSIPYHLLIISHIVGL